MCCSQVRVNCVNPTLVETDMAAGEIDTDVAAAIKARTPQEKFACTYILTFYLLNSSSYNLQFISLLHI